MGDQVSKQKVAVFRFLKKSKKNWTSSAEIAKGAGVVERTVRATLKQFENAGLIEAVSVFPGKRYRLVVKPSADVAKSAHRIIGLMERAEKVFATAEGKGG